MNHNHIYLNQNKLSACLDTEIKFWSRRKFYTILIAHWEDRIKFDRIDGDNLP